jgi:HSP20 family molecular chaperone IbpA
MDNVIRTRWFRLGALLALVLAAVALALPSLCGGAAGEEPEGKDAGKQEVKEQENKDAESPDFRIELDKLKGKDLDSAIDAQISQMLDRIEQLEKRMDRMGGRDLDQDRFPGFTWRQHMRDQFGPTMPSEVEELLKRLEQMWPHEFQRWLDHQGPMDQGPGGSAPFEFHMNLGPGEHAFSLRMDTEETDKAYIYKLDMPGMEKDAINVEVKDNVLSISGERKEQVEEEKDGQTVKREIVYGSFTRAVTLPGNADADKITSKYDNGVLTITVPKKEGQADQNRRIIVHQQ